MVLVLKRKTGVVRKSIPGIIVTAAIALHLLEGSRIEKPGEGSEATLPMLVVEAGSSSPSMHPRALPSGVRYYMSANVSTVRYSFKYPNDPYDFGHRRCCNIASIPVLLSFLRTASAMNCSVSVS